MTAHRILARRTPNRIAEQRRLAKSMQRADTVAVGFEQRLKMELVSLHALPGGGAASAQCPNRDATLSEREAVKTFPDRCSAIESCIGDVVILSPEGARIGHAFGSLASHSRQLQ